MFEKLEELAKNNKKISDFHIRSGSPLAYRQTGEIVMVKDVVVKPQDLIDMMTTNCNEHETKKFQDTHELDSAVTISGLRFRANFYKTLNGPAAVLRRVESKIPEMGQFDLPDVLYDIIDMHKGLVLVTGPTGSGKSTTLACMIDRINSSRSCRIITVEDPIEFTHSSKMATIDQREVQSDTKSFAKALKYILRQDPDVILIGEMRDQETISAALTAAETGHLVFATLHTNDAVQTIDRIVDVFPAFQQDQIRSQLAASLLAVISQRLLQNGEYTSRIPAFEIMLGSNAIRNLIRENKMHQALSVMAGPHCPLGVDQPRGMQCSVDHG